MNIRPARVKDEMGVKRIFSEYYRDPSSGLVEKDNVDYFAEKVIGFARKGETMGEQNFYFLVASGFFGRVLGVGGVRKPSSALVSFATTGNPLELYALFVLKKGKSVGSALNLALIEYAKLAGYTELIVHSSDRFQDSWNFYDKIGYKRLANIQEGTGRAQIWTMKLTSVLI